MSFADDVIDGVFCQQCGEYMDEGEGFPVTCAGCRDRNRLADSEIEAVADYIFGPEGSDGETQ